LKASEGGGASRDQFKKKTTRNIWGEKTGPRAPMIGTEPKAIRLPEEGGGGRGKVASGKNRKKKWGGAQKEGENRGCHYITG